MRCKIAFGNNEKVEAELIGIKDGMATVIVDGYDCSDTLPVSWITDIQHNTEQNCTNCHYQINPCNICSSYSEWKAE